MTDQKTESTLGQKKDLVEKINEWLESPQTHLDDSSRKRVIEAMVSEHVDKIRRSERNRTRGKDFLLIVAVLSAVASAVPFVVRYFLGGPI